MSLTEYSEQTVSEKSLIQNIHPLRLLNTKFSPLFVKYITIQCKRLQKYSQFLFHKFFYMLILGKLTGNYKIMKNVVIQHNRNY